MSVYLCMLMQNVV